MGASSYSDDAYTARMSSHATAGTDPFTHTASIASGTTASEVHEKLDPSKKNAAGKNVRESFDSDIHPNSRAVAVLFDVTGSMSSVPRVFIEKMPKLMSLLVKKAYLPNPHILFGAIGDAVSDRVPLQVGQFEGGNEMDEALSLIYLEGNGGGQQTESYELAMYFMARHTDMDCFKKRGEKGILFLLGDELPYGEVKKREVQAVIGDTLEANIPTADILKELREKFEVFWILPESTSNCHDRNVVDPLKAMFGQHFLRLENPADVCELICTTIGLIEGYDLNGIKTDLKDIGADADAVDRASSALVPFSKSAVSKAATASTELVAAGTDDVKRL